MMKKMASFQRIFGGLVFDGDDAVVVGDDEGEGGDDEDVEMVGVVQVELLLLS